MPTLQISHYLEDLALQSMEDSPVGGKFHPGESLRFHLPAAPCAMESWVTQTRSLPITSV